MKEVFYIPAICSTLANFCMGLGIFLTIGFLSVDLPSISERDYVANIDRLPFFFGIVLFTYEGIALVLPLKNAMKKPKNFARLSGVLNVGMVIASIIYIAIGILGYWRYGEDTLGSITLNLDTSNM